MTETSREETGDGGRVTPWALVFGAGDFDARFEDVRAEAQGRQPETATELLMLPAAGQLMREMLPPSDEGAAHGEVMAQVGALLFHAYVHWLHGRHVHRLGDGALRPLLTGDADVGEWRFRVPGPGGYVQLPRNAVWARVAEETAAEPVDGMFWSAGGAPERDRDSDRDSDSGGRLDLLVVLGVREGRPGVSLVDVAVETTAGLEQWAGADARPGGTDFANVLPGGELQGYHALTTRAEVLKLAVLCFWRIDTEEGASQPVEDRGERIHHVGDG